MFSRINKKSDNTDEPEVNLVPFIDLLSVCICFLLLTAVWVQAEVISTKQALGTEAAKSASTENTVWVELESNDSAIVKAGKNLELAPKTRVKIANLFGYLNDLHKHNPDIHTALVLPNVSSSYDSLVKTMNSLKKAEFKNIGITPL